jgi:hypothetical protein
MTRAKFRCVSVAKREGWGDNKVVYAAEFNVVGGDGNAENKAFFAASPSGRIELSTIREDHFEVGQDYYVEFTQCTN